MCAYDYDEVTSGAVSMAAKVIRARDKSSQLKDVKSSFTNILGHIMSTFKVWSMFAESLDTDDLQQYSGTFDESQFSFKQAKQASNNAASDRTKNALHVIPSLEFLFSYLLDTKDEYGATSPTYLACGLQARLLGQF